MLDVIIGIFLLLALPAYFYLENKREDYLKNIETKIVDE